VNTSVTSILFSADEHHFNEDYSDDFSYDRNVISYDTDFDELMARNKRLRCLFLFYARRMLLSVMCADECGVVWPYLLDSGDTDGIQAPDNIETLRAEFAAVVEERGRRAAIAER
jgi:hypothetical protein